jgi:hypothetical protein
MNQNDKSRTDGHQAAPDFISAWISGFYFITFVSADERRIEEVSP